MPKITPEESILLQSLATTSFLVELSNNEFLNSTYFEELQFENSGCKQILKQSGLGNPATMQMMLYALLTIPKEVLSRSSYEILESYIERINPLVYSLIEEETSSSYNGEEEKKKYMNRSNLTEKKPIITQKMINSFKRNLRKNFTSIKNQIEYEKLEREKEYLNNKIKINEYELE